MAKLKSKSMKNSDKPEDIEVLKSEVASFASSLGLSSTEPSSGFNDADFRKTGTLKPNKHPKKHKPAENERPMSDHNSRSKISDHSNITHQKPKPKPPVLSVNEGNKARGFDKFKNLPKLPLVKVNSLAVWYADAAELEAKVIGEGKKVEVKNVQEWKSIVEKKKELGGRLMAQYAQEYESTRGRSGDIKMLITTQRSGTAADKVSAFSVMVGDNPVANLRSLDALLAMVTSKVGKRHAVNGFEVLRELFVSSLLPDRKLKSLIQRPLNHLPETKDGYSLLLFWYWEECLKQRYERFIVGLEEASRDMLPILKQKALKTLYILLKSKSEQERRLLAALVNKLGDPGKNGASNAAFHLKNLLSNHPNMKAVIIDEVDTFLFRPHLGLQAKYHAVDFLSQIRLTTKGDGPRVAKRLIDVYFAVFKVLIAEASGDQKVEKGSKKTSKDSKEKVPSASHVELDSRLLSVLLTGINRAFPYVSSNEAEDVIDVQTPMLFQMVHSKNFNVGVQALMLLDKISSKNQIVSDRFYRALYAKLLLPAVTNTSKTEMLVGLLMRAMKKDINLKRVAAFSKRILQVALQQPPQYSCACLLLLSEVLKARPPLWNMMIQNESVDEELEHFEDVAEESENEPFVASEKQEDTVGLVQSGDVAYSESDSSEDESNHPSSSELDDSEEDLLLKNETDFVESEKVSAHNGQQAQVASKNSSLPGDYNPRHREPSYCKADRVNWWELTALAMHAHPSVATMAKTLLSGANIVYYGNPVKDLSLAAFLDKLMEKKPKPSTWHGGSQIEPAKKPDINNHFIGSEILSLAEADVPPEDLVFHKFYTYKMNTSKKPKKKKKKAADEEAAVELFGVDGDDESDNEEIEYMLDASRQTLEEDDDYDYDDLDRVANEDDEDLTGDVSDAEMETPTDIVEDFDVSSDGNDSDDNSSLNIGDMDDGSDGGDNDNEEEVATKKRKRKRRSSGNNSESPFASYEDYEHLLNDSTESEKQSSRKNKSKNSKKRKKLS